MGAQSEYNYLKQREELFDLFPDFTGDWVEDRTVFEKYFDDNMTALNEIPIYDTDEDYFYDDNNFDNLI